MIQSYVVPWRDNERVSDLRRDWENMSDAARDGLGQFGAYVLVCMVGGRENVKRWMERVAV